MTEDDLRLPEFRGVKLEELERRPHDGKIVRKDRWMTGMFEVAEALDLSTRDFEIQDVIDAAHDADAARDVLNEAFKTLSAPGPCWSPTEWDADRAEAYAAGKRDGRREGMCAALKIITDSAADAGYIFK